MKDRKSHCRDPRRSRPARLAGLALLAALTSACAVRPEPLTDAEVETRIVQDLEAMFADQEPVDGPVTLHEAMARALRYNLDGRLRVMEEALEQRQLDLSRYDMLPELAANAGYEGRSNTSASFSEDVVTGETSLRTSTSLDDHRGVGDLTTVWNVLDFGVSYVSARQQADRSLIAYERRRKAVHVIIQDVRTAYWQAVAAERLLGRVEPLLGRVESALADARTLEEQRLRPPLEILTYQRALLDTQRQLETLRRDLVLANAQLASLINLPPGESVPIAAADPGELTAPRIDGSPAEMERIALAYRPELREEDYQTRISAAETRKAMLRMLPGLEFDVGLDGDTNSFLFNNVWGAFGSRLSWSLLTLVTGPAQIDLAEAQESVVEARRRALSMAVLAQVYVSWLGYQEALHAYETARELARVEDRILAQLQAGRETGRGGELELIQGELRAVLASLRRDLAFAQLQNAAGQVFVSIGADPMPAQIASADVDALAAALAEVEAGWYRGDYNLLSRPEDASAMAAASGS
jgi:outer membrane protein TolC